MLRHSRRFLIATTVSFSLITLFLFISSYRRQNYATEDGEVGQKAASITPLVAYQFGEESSFLNLDCHPKADYLQSTQNDQNEAAQSVSNQHILEYVNIPTRAAPYDFSKCTMSNCFDFSRCRPEGPLKVHIVPSLKTTPRGTNITLGESNLIHKTIIKTIRESKHFEPDAEKACLFVLEDDTLDRDPLSQSFRSDLANIFRHSNVYGMNHLVFNLYSGSWPDYRENDFAGLQIGAAILAKASNSKDHHRQGFDISLPLFSYLHPSSSLAAETDHTVDPINRDIDGNTTYFLTFKGKRYVFGSGSDTRNSLYHLNNQRDVIMLTTCRHGKKWRESVDYRCSEDEANYDQYDFVDLMKESRFCLTPRGRRLGSFRFLEALGHGCIPVILSDGWVKPFDEIIDWSCATVQYEESLVLLVPDMLRDFSQVTTRKMRENCRILYKKYFSTIERIILTTVSIIEQRIHNHFRLKNKYES